MKQAELDLRQKLGIPTDAAQVMILAESSHWDPNWLKTSEQYYRQYVKHNLDDAIAFLEKAPRRRYSVECAFFLRMYWDRNPQQQEKIRSLMNEGRLWMTSSGVTTADTLIPDGEALLRDLLIGQEWLRAIGVRQHPRTAYFTDSFGCTPFLPSILQAAGFSRTAFTRVDGMLFMGTDYEPARNFPRPGSSAELLGKHLKTQDFTWRDANGARLLCHWNAFTYGQGDMLDARGITKIYIFPLFVRAHSRKLVRRRIEQFRAQLSSLARTPYLFCPIGFDFTAPIEPLIELVDRYNTFDYPQSGCWLVNATLDDYLDLVGEYEDSLPQVQSWEPNPYWTGFYSARPYLKQLAHRSLDQMLLLERLSLNPAPPIALDDEFHRHWWTLAACNHHDLITGTSPDAVMDAESYPWLEKIAAYSRRQLARATANEDLTPTAELPRWRREENSIIVETNRMRLTFDEQRGGCLAGFVLDETDHLGGITGDIVSYADSGGLWRMGNEFRGGVFKELLRSSRQPARVVVDEKSDHLCLSVEHQIEGESIVQQWYIFEHMPFLFGSLTGRAPIKSTLTLRFEPAFPIKVLHMLQPGGVARRPLEKIYTPTFWSMQHFVHASSEPNRPGMALFSAQPTAVAFRADAMEMVALRNATIETAFGLIGIPANPAKGFEKQGCSFHFALSFTPHGNWKTNRLEETSARLLRHALWNPYASLHEELSRQVQVRSSLPVVVKAIKPAEDQQGIILRLAAYQLPQDDVQLDFTVIQPQRAWLCDARENRLEPLPVKNNTLTLNLTQSLTTVRLEVEPSP